MSGSGATGPVGRSMLGKPHAEFAAGLAARLEAIESSWRLLQQGHAVDAFDSLFLQVHRLSGAGGTFGFPAISRAAAGVEKVLRQTARIETATPEDRAAIGVGLAELRAACRAAVDQPFAEAVGVARPMPARGGNLHKLVLIEDDAELAAHLAGQLEAKGYQVAIHEQPGDLLELTLRLRPAALLMDIVFESGRLAGAEAVATLQAGCTDPPPVVFFSSRPDLEARLAAVRAGGTAYFTKPLDVPLLIERLDVLTGRRPQMAYRVLLVDDDEQLARLYERTLQEAGMEARVCTDPMLALEALSGLEPDLVLLDFHMPGCSGPDLAQVLRQTAGFESLPIVFLSTEVDRAQQLRAMTAGGDEFLNKPIDPEHLVAAVASRAERGRELQGLLERDGLTRLLNHASLRRNLEVELARARRLGKPLCFAMIDLDGFKAINDEAGHLIGDRVLRSLANLLSERLRITDVIGRYAGDEFAVVLPMTTPEAALQVLDSVREQFAGLDQLEGRRATFSGGVAAFPQIREGGELLEAADRALYEAKRSGRNRVALAVPE